MNTKQLTDGLAQIPALAATIAALLCIVKASGFVIGGVPGSVETWAYVAIACAAARFARMPA
jgi:hypothetical protein